MSALERDDAAALTVLVKSDPPPGLRDELLAALGDNDPTLRANALQVLSAMDDQDDAFGRIRTAISDPHPVVRRYAAMAAYQLRASELADALASQAKTDPDKLAAETLVDFAIDLADNDTTAMQMAFSAQPRVLDRAIRALLSRCGREVVLRALHEDETLNLSRIQRILLVLAEGNLRSDWSSSEVATLTHILMAQPHEIDELRNMREALASQPITAVLVRLCYPPGEQFLFDIDQSVSVLDDAGLTELFNLLDTPLDEIAIAAGIELGAELDPGSVDQARDYVQANITARRTRQVKSSASAGKLDIEPQSQIDTSSPEGCADVLQRPPASVRAQASTEQIATIHRYVEEHLAELTAQQELAQYVGPAMMPPAVWHTLEWAAHFDLELTPDAWLQIAQPALRWSDQPIMDWLQRAWDASWTGTLEALLDTLPSTDKAAAADVLPTPWPDALVSAALDSARSAELTGLQRQQIATVVQRASGNVQVRAWLAADPTTWLLPYAVEIGNCEAEQRLLEEITTDPVSGPHWPLRGHASWLAHVRCPSSTEALTSALRAALLAERDTPDLEPLYKALNRCAGLEVLAIYDRLINDPEIPHARFHYYQRQTALNALAETEIRSRELQGRSLDGMINELTADDSAS